MAPFTYQCRLTRITMVLRLHGYGAWIESDGKPLDEYAVEVKDNVVSCYVCSEEGKVWTNHPSPLWNSNTPDRMCPQDIQSTL